MWLALLPAGVTAADPFEINAVLPMTGSSAFSGSSMSRTLSIIEKHVNATGGIGGRPVHFVISDDQSTPQLSVQIVNGLVAKHVAAFVGPAIASTCRAAMPLLDNGPVMYCLSPVLYPPTGSYGFAGGASSIDETGVLLNYLHRTRGWKRVAIDYADRRNRPRADTCSTSCSRGRSTAICKSSITNISDSPTSPLPRKSPASSNLTPKQSSRGVPARRWQRVSRVARRRRRPAGVLVRTGNQTYTAMEQWRSILPRQYYQ